MITLDELRNAPTVLRNPVYRSYLEILLGRKRGKCHSKAILKKLQGAGLLDSNHNVTLIGIRALDSK